jgi:hypothetical protein
MNAVCLHAARRSYYYRDARSSFYDLCPEVLYMNSFTEASSLSQKLTISLSSQLPVVVEYKIAEMGYVRF